MSVPSSRRKSHPCRVSLPTRKLGMHLSITARAGQPETVDLLRSFRSVLQDAGEINEVLRPPSVTGNGNRTYRATSPSTPSTRRNGRRPPASSRRWRWTSVSRSSLPRSSARGRTPPTSRASATTWRTRLRSAIFGWKGSLVLNLCPWNKWYRCLTLHGRQGQAARTRPPRPGNRPGRAPAGNRRHPRSANVAGEGGMRLRFPLGGRSRAEVPRSYQTA